MDNSVNLQVWRRPTRRDSFDLGSETNNNTLVRVRRGDAWLTPIFVLHDATGDVLSSVRLARTMSGARPVHGIKARVAHDGQPLDVTVESMAASAVESIRAVQRTGPVTLMGYSFGCVVAFETARILERSGRDVERVILLDPYVGDRCLPPIARIWFLSVQRPWSVTRWFSTVDWTERRRFLKRLATRLVPWMMNAAIPQMNEPSPDAQMVRLAQVAVRAQAAYRPRHLGVPVTILNCAQKFPCQCNPMPVLMRALNRDKVDVHLVQGAHPDMMNEPGVHTTAAIVSFALGEAVALAG